MSPTAGPSPLRELRPDPGNPAMTLVFAHHAGGSALSYLPLARLLPEDWRVLGVELPGRITADDEVAFTGCGDAVRWLLPHLREVSSGPYALFGHSMGALVGFELVRALAAAGRPPVWLGVSASPAPGMRPGARRDLWPEHRLVDLMNRLGGTPGPLLSVPGLRERMVRVLRDDLALVDTYRYRPGPALDVPLSVWRAGGDSAATAVQMRPWHTHSTAPPRSRVWEGGHFYLFDQAAAVAAALAEEIARVGVRRP
ncbi:thioesterase [Kineosporia sp. J2-2]|uniref:Thioesterase n=1 Tax=Kineosporia corallincola TaxID=2835133 RepID=A0ABS5TMM7_9ACTN|nr:alpha/beta fold hydrolase [Kineosporia corallincola]MBT0772353.1 thioesterase [Kineosporia corallincola]